MVLGHPHPFARQSFGIGGATGNAQGRYLGLYLASLVMKTVATSGSKASWLFWTPCRWRYNTPYNAMAKYALHP